MSREAYRDLFLAFSLADIAMSNIWARLLFARRIDLPLYSPVDFAAVIVNVLGLTLCFWLLLTAGRSLRGIYCAFRYIPFVAYLILVDFVRRHIGLAFTEALRLEGRLGGIAMASMVALAVVSAAVHWRRRLLAGAEILTLCLVPLAPLQVLTAAGKLAASPSVGATSTASASELPPLPEQPRLLWLHFDELDYRLTFPDRPRELNLPELDRFRRESLFAEDVHAPTDSTASSTAALLTGRIVLRSIITVPGEQLVVFQGGEQAVALRTQPNVFRQARAAGWNVAIAGWFLPYCNMFGDVLVRCTWQPSDLPPASDHLLQAIRSQLRSLSPLEFRMNHRDAYRTILRSTKELACDPAVSFVFVHWPIPHAPFIYDRKAQRFTVFRFSPEGYFDNLVLLDHSLGELRRAMEQAGTWDRTVIVVTSDHWWRLSENYDGKKDRRVPFMVKLARQKEGRVYERPLRYEKIHDLVLTLLDGQVPDSESAVRWLDEHGSSP